jgi:uncharacterized protein YkwD
VKTLIRKALFGRLGLRGVSGVTGRFFILKSKKGYQSGFTSNTFMFQLFKLKLTLAIIGAFCVFIPVTLAADKSDDFKSESWEIKYREKILEMVNKERKSNDFGELMENKELEKAAEMKAEDMAKGGYFSHVTPDGKDPWHWLEINGIKYSAAGENLAAKFKNPAKVVPAWMESPTHKKNVLNSEYTQTGIGIAKGEYEGKEVIFVVELYLKPAKKVASN